jgi:hypothetical protein
MNERILDLAVKSGHIVDELPLNANQKIQLAGLEKFAELIIAECIEVFSKDLPDPTSPDYKLGTLNEVVDRVCAVVEHFGVKE